MTALAPAARTASTDIDALQGAWETVAGRRHARLFVAGRHFCFAFVGGEVYIGTLDLAHGQMDMHVQAGPAEHVGQTSRCLVQLADGVLRWCPGRPGSGRRPAYFPGVDDAKGLCLLFRRDWHAAGR